MRVHPSQGSQTLKPAHKIDATITRTADKYVRSVKSLGLRVRSEVIRAWLDGTDIGAALRRGLVGLDLIIAAGMLAGYAEGYAEAIERADVEPQKGRIYFARPMAPSRPTRIFEQAAKFAEKRAKLSPYRMRKLRDLYTREAVSVSGRITGELERKVQKAVAKAIRANVHTAQGTQMIRDAFDAAGVTPKNAGTFETIFRTQVSIAYNAARMHANDRPEIREILWGYRYNTVGDDRVRPTHRAMNGVRAPVDDPLWAIWTPPCGYRCRCTLIEIYKTDPARSRTKKYPPFTVKDASGKEVPVEPDPGFAFNPADVFREVMG